MTTALKNTRFCFNNWVDAGSYTTSPSNPLFPNTNLVSEIRSKVWKPLGTFEITLTNQKVYLNATIYTVPVGVYTAATLITAFNTATSETLTRNGLGRFTITLGAAGTFDFSQQTNAIWETLGFLGNTDVAGTVAVADERRYNNGEWIQVDMGLPQIPNFAAIIGESEQVFSCPTATVKLQGNNVNNWVSPPVDEPMTVSSEGAFVASDSELIACRYWRIYIDDVKNSAISVAVAGIFDGLVNVNTNFATRFSRNRIDQSDVSYSEGGQLYVNRKPRLLKLTSCSVEFLKEDELREMEQLFYDLGVGRPFFIVIDPAVGVSQTLSQMTHYVAVDSDVTLSHVINSYYNLSFQLREVL